jgi:hypothetical protein
MTKNIIIIVLALAVMMCWIKVDPECMAPDDPDSVVIEYKCSELVEYEDIPKEVTDECRDRANQSTNHKNNT